MLFQKSNAKFIFVRLTRRIFKHRFPERKHMNNCLRVRNSNNFVSRTDLSLFRETQNVLFKTKYVDSSN